MYCIDWHIYIYVYIYIVCVCVEVLWNACVPSGSHCDWGWWFSWSSLPMPLLACGKKPTQKKPWWRSRGKAKTRKKTQRGCGHDMGPNVVMPQCPRLVSTKTVFAVICWCNDGVWVLLIFRLLVTLKCKGKEDPLIHCSASDLVGINQACSGCVSRVLYQTPSFSCSVFCSTVEKNDV